MPIVMGQSAARAGTAKAVADSSAAVRRALRMELPFVTPAERVRSSPRRAPNFIGRLTAIKRRSASKSRAAGLGRTSPSIALPTPCPPRKPSRNYSIEVVFHNRSMRPCAVPLQRVDVARQVAGFTDRGFDLVAIRVRQGQRRNRQISLKMRSIACADDYRRDPLALQRGRACNARDVDPVAICDAAQDREQALKQSPSAELLDDEPVFDQRSVFQLAARRRRAKPFVA